MELSALQACTTIESRATHHSPGSLLTVMSSVSMALHPVNVTCMAAHGAVAVQVTLLGSVTPVTSQPGTATPLRNPAKDASLLSAVLPNAALLLAIYRLSRLKVPVDVAMCTGAVGAGESGEQTLRKLGRLTASGSSGV